MLSRILRHVCHVGLLVCLAVVALQQPAAAAEPDSFQLTLQDAFRLRDATLLVGQLVVDGPAWSGPVILDAREAQLDEGTLYVCPKGPGPTVGPAVPGTQPPCTDGASHAAEVLSFGRGTDLRFAGSYLVDALPAGSLSLLTGGERHAAAHLFSSQPLVLSRTEKFFQFTPASVQSAIFVNDPQAPTWYNGTQWSFTFSGSQVSLLAGGAAGWYDDDLRIRLQPGDRHHVREVLEPFLLLDLQELLLGPNAREPRANVTGLLTEYGRVSDYVNAAIVGRINGTIGTQSHAGDVALVRIESLSAVLSGDALTGTVEPIAQVTSSGIAIKHGPMREAPWGISLGLWLAALAAVVLAPRPSARGRVQWALRLVSPVAAWAVVDLGVMNTAMGNSVLTGGLRGEFDLPDLLALLAFEMVTLAAAMVLILLPARVFLLRFVRQRAALVEGVLIAVWLVSLVVVPGAYFALGHELARL